MIVETLKKDSKVTLRLELSDKHDIMFFVLEGAAGGRFRHSSEIKVTSRFNTKAVLIQ